MTDEERAAHMAELIERSSLGTEGAKALRARTSPERAARLVSQLNTYTKCPQAWHLERMRGAEQ